MDKGTFPREELPTGERVEVLQDIFAIPVNVRVQKYSYTEMCQLYASSHFVVVPLHKTGDSVGSSAILEAMAMGKAVIVTGTCGQIDVLRDPRDDGRRPIVREWWPGFAEMLGKLLTLFYVRPHDPEDLSDRIQYLLDHPEVAAEMGRNGRLLIETFYGVEPFIKRYSATILDQPQPDYSAYSDKIANTRGSTLHE